MLKLKHNKKKLGAFLCTFALLTSFAVPVFASAYYYDWIFSGTGESWGMPEKYYYKDDNEQYAYLSVKSYSGNWNTGVDRVYAWVQDQNTHALTEENYYFTDKVTSKKLHYFDTIDTTTKVGLVGWHNNNGTSKSFTINGQWTP